MLEEDNVLVLISETSDNDEKKEGTTSMAKVTQKGKALETNIVIDLDSVKVKEQPIAATIKSVDIRGVDAHAQNNFKFNNYAFTNAGNGVLNLVNTNGDVIAQYYGNALASHVIKALDLPVA